MSPTSYQAAPPRINVDGILSEAFPYDKLYYGILLINYWPELVSLYMVKYCTNY